MEYPNIAKFGLKNMGNTCYFNSSIQLLINNPYFYNYIKYVSKKYPLAYLFKKLVSDNNPEKLKEYLDHKNPYFENFNQHDSHECLNWLLDNLYEESSPTEEKIKSLKYDENEKLVIRNYKKILHKIKNNNDKNAVIKLEMFLSDMNCQFENILDRYYGFKYIKTLFTKKYNIFSACSMMFVVSKIKCKKCNYVGLNYTHFQILQLNVCNSVYEGFEEYFNEKNLTDYKCEHCSEKNVSISYKMINVPKIIYVCLSKYTAKNIKNNSNITVDENINIFNFCNKNQQKNKKTLNYKLIGCINHYGNVMGGHYTADCYDLKTKQWTNFNDERTTTQKRADFSNGYIFMYAQIDNGVFQN
jgi:ubiquitin C-terminal hydrolase